MEYLILVIVIGLFTSFSSWIVYKLSLRSDQQALAGNNGKGQIKLIVLVFVSTSLGVSASYYMYGKRIDFITIAIISALVAGTTLIPKIKTTEFIASDFFAFFSQGFTWPSLLPKIAEILNIEESLIDLSSPTLTPTPSVTPDSGILIDSLKEIVQLLVDII